MLHLSRDNLLGDGAGASSGTGATNITFAVELDTLGNAMQTGRWRRLATITISAPEWYTPHVFERGLSAHWVRVVALSSCDACSATFIYT